MKRPIVQIILGVLVLIAGVLLLLEATGTMPSPPVLWSAVLLAASATFGYVFFADRRSWWAAIPSSALLGAGVARLMEIDPDGLGQWTEVPVLAAIGIGFLAIYLRDHHRWWALIPGGMLVTLSVLTAVTADVGAAVSGAIFLFGAALTFALVAVLPGGGSRHWWSYIPAAVLALAAVAVLLTEAEWVTVLNIVWPIVVIVSGGFLIWRAVRSRRLEHRVPADAEDRPPARVSL